MDTTCEIRETKLMEERVKRAELKRGRLIDREKECR